MAKQRSGMIAGLGLVAVLIAGGLVAAGGTAQPVKVQAVALKPGAAGPQTIKVTLAVSKGWHVYANPVGNEDFEGAATTIKVSANGKAQAAEVKYPAGTKHEEKGVGSMQVYEGEVSIPVVVRGTGPFEVSVTYQACDAKKCLPPKTEKITVR